VIEPEIQVEIDKLKQRIRALETSPSFDKTRVTNVGTPRNSFDATTKRYVDDQIEKAVGDLRTTVLALKRKVG